MNHPKAIFIGSCLLFLFGCTSAPVKEETTSTSEEKLVVAEEAAYPTIEVGKGPDALFLTPQQDMLYVANVEDTFISVIDTKLDNVVATISGVRYPWGFTHLRNSNLVAASGWDKQIAIIDFTTHQVVKEKTFSSNLGGITSSADGEFIYVIAATDKKVLKLNRNLDIVATFDTGNGADGIGISEDNSKVYVTNTKDGSISIIHLKDGTASLIQTGGKPELVHPSADGKLLYISNFLENKVHVLDTRTDSVIHEITALDGTEEAIVDRNDQQLYVVNFNTAKLFVYDIPNYTKLKTEYSTGNKPIGVIATNDKLYVTNYGDNTVSVIPHKRVK